MWAVKTACQMIAMTRKLPSNGVTVRVEVPYTSDHWGWRRSHGWQVGNQVTRQFKDEIDLTVSIPAFCFKPQGEVTVYHFQIGVTDEEWERWLVVNPAPRLLAWLSTFWKVVKGDHP